MIDPQLSQSDDLQFEKLQQNHAKRNSNIQVKKPGFLTGIGTAIKLAIDLYWYPQKTHELLNKISIPDFQHAMRWFSEKKVLDLTKQRLEKATELDLERAAFFATDSKSIKAIKEVAHSFFLNLKPIKDMPIEAQFLMENIKKWHEKLPNEIKKTYEKMSFVTIDGTSIQLEKKLPELEKYKFPKDSLKIALIAQAIYDAYQKEHPEMSDEKTDQKVIELLTRAKPTSDEVHFIIP